MAEKFTEAAKDAREQLFRDPRYVRAQAALVAQRMGPDKATKTLMREVGLETPAEEMMRRLDKAFPDPKPWWIQ